MKNAVSGLFWVLAFAASAHATTYTFTDLGNIAAYNEFVHPTDINNSGQIVGETYIATLEHPFFWENGVMKDIGGGLYGTAWGINDGGQVSGRTFDLFGGSFGFLWQNGASIDLGSLGSGITLGTGLNNLGQVVGASYPPTLGPAQAFVWQNNVMTALSAQPGAGSYGFRINDHGQVVGGNVDAGPDHALFWDSNGAFTDLGTLGTGQHSQADAINNLGQVVGYSELLAGSNVSHAFLWQNGAMTDLGAFGKTYSEGSDINNKGQVVGWYGEGGFRHAFLYSQGVFTDIHPAGMDFSVATGINDEGQIIGYGGNNFETSGFLLTPSRTTTVPEPPTAGLLLLALSTLPVLKHRRG